MQVFNLHALLFSLKEEEEDFKGYKFEILTKEGDTETIEAEDVIVTTRNLCFWIVKDDKKQVVPFYRVKRVHNKEGTLIWDNT